MTQANRPPRMPVRFRQVHRWQFTSRRTAHSFCPCNQRHQRLRHGSLVDLSLVVQGLGVVLALLLLENVGTRGRRQPFWLGTRPRLRISLLTSSLRWAGGSFSRDNAALSTRLRDSGSFGNAMGELGTRYKPARSRSSHVTGAALAAGATLAGCSIVDSLRGLERLVAPQPPGASRANLATWIVSQLRSNTAPIAVEALDNWPKQLEPLV